MSKDLPLEVRFGKEPRAKKLEETIATLSSVIPNLVERIVSKTPGALSFLVQLTADEHATLLRHLLQNPGIASTLVDGQHIQAGKLS